MLLLEGRLGSCPQAAVSTGRENTMLTMREAMETERYKRERAYKAADKFVDELRTGETMPEPDIGSLPRSMFWLGVSLAMKRYGLLYKATVRRPKDLEVSRDGSGYVYRLKQTLGVDKLEAEAKKLRERLAEIEGLLKEE